VVVVEEEEEEEEGRRSVGTRFSIRLLMQSEKDQLSCQLSWLH